MKTLELQIGEHDKKNNDYKLLESLEGSTATIAKQFTIKKKGRQQISDGDLV